MTVIDRPQRGPRHQQQQWQRHPILILLVRLELLAPTHISDVAKPLLRYLLLAHWTFLFGNQKVRLRGGPPIVHLVLCGGWRRGVEVRCQELLLLQFN